MEKKKKLSPLALKIIIPLAGVLVAFILTLNIALSKISRTIESMTQLKDTDLITLNIAQDLRYSVLLTSEFFTDVSVVQELDEIDGGEEIKATVEADIAELSKIDPENAAYYNDVLSEYHVFYDLCKSMAYAYITEGTDAGNAVMEQVDPHTEALSDIMDSIAGQKHANAENSALKTSKDITLVKNILSFAGIFVLGFIVATVAVVFLAVVRPVKIVTNAISTLADRDLTLSELPIKSKDEMGQLTEGFNRLLVSTRDVMQQIQDSSANVDKGSVSVKTSADAIQENMTAIAEAVSNIAQGANDQAIEIEKTNEEIESLKEIIETNERAAGNLSEACEKISQASNEGTKIINDLYDVTKQSEAAFADIFTSIESIKDSSEKIRTASSMIESISSQTNLLSLNASIEAARAGEHGRGFAVVADEIRSLSDETQNCVLEINNMIENLQATVDLASVKSDGIKLTVEKQVKSVSDTKDKYADITNSVSAINEEITGLGSVSSALSESVINVTEIMHVVASASEESSASTEETNASVEEVLAMVEEIAGEAADITSVSNVLKDQAALYKL